MPQNSTATICSTPPVPIYNGAPEHLHSKSSIASIAQQVGFANQAHLNVHIKRVLGVTPKAILEQRKNP